MTFYSKEPHRIAKYSSPIPVDRLVDSHIHTHLCGHAIDAMEEYVQIAIRKGLKEIIFLEHMESGICKLQGNTWLSEDEFASYFSEGQRLKTQNIFLAQKIGIDGINTSGFALRREQFTSRRILAMAHNYNIPFVLGSDAHKPEDVGRYFDINLTTHPSKSYP